MEHTLGYVLLVICVLLAGAGGLYAWNNTPRKRMRRRLQVEREAYRELMRQRDAQETAQQASLER